MDRSCTRLQDLLSGRYGRSRRRRGTAAAVRHRQVFRHLGTAAKASPTSPSERLRPQVGRGPGRQNPIGQGTRGVDRIQHGHHGFAPRAPGRLLTPPKSGLPKRQERYAEAYGDLLAGAFLQRRVYARQTDGRCQAAPLRASSPGVLRKALLRPPRAGGRIHGGGEERGPPPGLKASATRLSPLSDVEHAGGPLRGNRLPAVRDMARRIQREAAPAVNAASYHRHGIARSTFTCPVVVHPETARRATSGKWTSERHPRPEPALDVGRVYGQNKNTLDSEPRRWHLSRYLKRCSSVARLPERGRGARKL